MRIKLLARILSIAVVLGIGAGQGSGFAQSIVYRSPNPKTDPTVKVNDMLKIDYKKVFDLRADLKGGSMATISAGGKISIKVYLYDDTKADGKGLQVYYSWSNTTSAGYVEIVEDVPHTGGIFTASTKSNDIKKLAQDAKIYLGDGCKSEERLYFNSLMNVVSLGLANMKSIQCVEYYTPVQPVVVEVTADNATLSKIKVPGMGELTPDQITGPRATQVDGFLNPNGSPNYIMLAAHRGYWKDDTPENSLEALQHAMTMGVEMVEIDVRQTKDGELVLAHDLHLGRLTDIPAHIQGNAAFQKNGHYMISQMTLRDIRPDLYNDNTRQPVHLKNIKGEVKEKMPTLKEVFELCRYKTIVDVDKIEGFYHKVFALAQSMNMLRQVVVKGRYESPTKLKEAVATEKFTTGLPAIDWKNYMFTPIYFPEFEMNFQTSIHAFVEDTNFNCPGVELVYVNYPDSLTPFIAYLKSKNKQVIQFPQYPENTGGVFNPKQYQYSDIDPRFDHRNDWEWLLDANRRPTLIITDRLEVLQELLTLKKLRDK